MNLKFVKLLSMACVLPNVTSRVLVVGLGLGMAEQHVFQRGVFLCPGSTGRTWRRMELQASAQTGSEVIGESAWVNVYTQQQSTPQRSDAHTRKWMDNWATLLQVPHPPRGRHQRPRFSLRGKEMARDHEKSDMKKHKTFESREFQFWSQSTTIS
ncbi:hypothetical protein FQN60_001619, partial [Etheostoma spectabile]